MKCGSLLLSVGDNQLTFNTLPVWGHHRQQEPDDAESLLTTCTTTTKGITSLHVKSILDELEFSEADGEELPALLLSPRRHIDNVELHRLTTVDAWHIDGADIDVDPEFNTTECQQRGFEDYISHSYSHEEVVAERGGVVVPVRERLVTVLHTAVQQRVSAVARVATENNKTRVQQVEMRGRQRLPVTSNLIPKGVAYDPSTLVCNDTFPVIQSKGFHAYQKSVEEANTKTLAWERIRHEGDSRTFVCNQNKTGILYWVFTKGEGSTPPCFLQTLAPRDYHPYGIESKKFKVHRRSEAHTADELKNVSMLFTIKECAFDELPNNINIVGGGKNNQLGGWEKAMTTPTPQLSPDKNTYVLSSGALTFPG